ncbi:lysine-specific demethylase 6B-like [Salvia splendens]|uniref:lysine-specific demethylase 6B-like n=1 Tax=Salvia splendens TaxID=180675 RepID=UPI001C2676C3|nr:lysine-specific demethylase 6B-like [Salvia splendens]
MGKKKMAHKQASGKFTSTVRKETPKTPPPITEQPPNPQPQPRPPSPQAPTMVSLNALAEFLRQQDPNKDWAAALAGFSQIGGQSSLTAETPVVPTPPTSIPPSSTIPPEKRSPSTTAPSEYSEPFPHIEPMDFDSLCAYYDSDPAVTEGKKGEEKRSREEGDESERTPVVETVSQRMGREEIDLNETARKQGLMTDEEFEELLNKVTRMEDGTAKMAEGLDLASEAVGDGEEASTRNDPEGLAHQPEDEVEERQTREEEPKSVTPQPEAGESDTHIEKDETVVRTEGPEPVAPPVSKPKAVKRKLVLKSDPKAERPKPKRVSQRCLGKWTSSKAKANTAADAVEVSSEEERTTPTKPGEESLSTTN